MDELETLKLTSLLESPTDGDIALVESFREGEPPDKFVYQDITRSWVSYYAMITNIKPGHWEVSIRATVGASPGRWIQLSNPYFKTAHAGLLKAQEWRTSMENNPTPKWLE